MSYLLHNLLRFARLLRRLGLDVQPSRTLDVANALGYIDVGRRQDFYYTLRTLLVHRADDLPAFDEAFRLFWRPPKSGSKRLDLQTFEEGPRVGAPEVELASLSADPEASSGDGSSAKPERVEVRTYSAREALRQKNFAELRPDELEESRRLLAELVWEPGLRRSRRWTAGCGQALDLRRLLRNSLRSAGESFVIPTRTPKQRRRPIVLICDISGSMARYTSMLLSFMLSMSEGFERVEAFVFSTRLTRITPHLRRRRTKAALAKLQAAAPDWSGGTRIGEALFAFNSRWARRALRGGPVVLLISDGWDRGDPPLLRREMARLQRSCHRLVWLNPLLGSPAYEPLTRGMQAALPFIDDFLPVHNLVSLERLAERLNTLPPRRPTRRSQRSL